MAKKKEREENLVSLFANSPVASLCFPTQVAEHERSPQRGHWYLDSAPQEEQGLLGLGFGGGGGGGSSRSSSSSSAAAGATTVVGAPSASFSTFPSLGSLVLSSAASPVKFLLFWIRGGGTT